MDFTYIKRRICELTNESLLKELSYVQKMCDECKQDTNLPIDYYNTLRSYVEYEIDKRELKR